MAGYFHYLGRVFTEKGSWYKLVTITVLQLIIIVASVLFMQQLNIPGIILYSLCLILFSGYIFQIYENGMKNERRLLPAIDFGAMFVTFLKFLPFLLVWIVYLVLFIFVLCYLPVRAISLPLPVFCLLIAACLLGIQFPCMVTFPALVAIRAGNGSNKYILNPLTPFRIFSQVGLAIFLLSVLIGLLSIGLSLLLTILGFLIGFSGGGEQSVSETIASLLVGFIGLGVYNAFSIAFHLRVCDIVKVRLGDTKYLNINLDIPAAETSWEDDSDY